MSMETIEIYIRKSRIYRHILLALLWYSIIAYRIYLGIPLGGMDALAILAGMSFSFWFYVEWKRPYITIKEGHFQRGLFRKERIALKDINEWKNQKGVLYLNGAKKSVRVVPSMISQKDMERVYEVLTNKDNEQE